MTDFFPMPGCRLERITAEASDLLHIAAHATRPCGRCPDCGRASRAVHSRYRRKPADLPSLGRKVRVGLRVRRFYCRNAACARRTFAERLPDLVKPHARRTCRLAEAQGRVGAALGGEAGARLLRRLAMPASADTVLRLIRRLPLLEQDVPRVVGVDDWALRRERTYGTVVVDMERRRVADLLPDRTAATVAGWLWQRPGIEVVARDRSTEYARAAAIGAPRQPKWRIAGICWPTCAKPSSAGCTPPTPGSGACRCRQPEKGPRRSHPAASRRSGATVPSGRQGPESRARWQARHDEVRRRHLRGEPLMAIARATGLARATVRKFARAESFPARLPHGPGPSILDPYLTYLERRLAEGCENGLALWRELRGMGFPGGNKQVLRWLAGRRTVPAKVGRPRNQSTDGIQTAVARDKGPPLPAPRQLAWLLVRPVAALGAADAAAVSRVERDGEAKAVAGLARRFTALVRACGVRGRREGRAPAEPTGELNAGLADARACSVPAIEPSPPGWRWTVPRCAPP
jgi:transposase